MNGQHRRRRVPDEEWENHKTIIYHLYITEGKTLEQVVDAMESDHGFSASKAQYETRLNKKWGFRKYASKTEWRIIDQIFEARAAESKETEVYLHGAKLSCEKVRKERMRHRHRKPTSQTPQDTAQTLPDCIRIKTPTLDNASLVSRTRRCPPTTPDQHLETAQVNGQNSPAIASFETRVLPFSPRNPEIFDVSANANEFFLDSSIQFQPLSPVDPVNTFRSFCEPLMEPSMLLSPFDSGLNAPIGLHDQMNFGYKDGTISLLKRVDTNIFILVRDMLQGQEVPADTIKSTLETFCPQSVCCFLFTQTLEIQLACLLLLQLINNFMSIDGLVDPQNPLDYLQGKMIRHLLFLPSRTLLQFLDSVSDICAGALERSLFCAAVELGASTTVSIMLRRGVDPNRVVISCSGNRFSPLKVSVRNGHVEVTHYLLSGGADYKMITYQDCLAKDDPLGTVTRTSIEHLEMFLKMGRFQNHFDINELLRYRDPRVLDVIVRSISGPNELLITENILPDSLRRPETATVNFSVQSILSRPWSQEFRLSDAFKRCLTCSLSNAAYYNNMDAFEMILAAGGIPTPNCLSNSVRAKNIPAIEKLLDLGVSPIQSPTYKYSEYHREVNNHGSGSHLLAPISEAIMGKCQEILEIFERGGFFADIESTYGNSVLESTILAACTVGDNHLFSALLSRWSPRGRVTSSIMENAFIAAIDQSNSEMVYKLLQSGVRPSCHSLQLAVLDRHKSIIRLLIDSIEDTSDDEISLHLAVTWGDVDVIQDLISARLPLYAEWDATESIGRSDRTAERPCNVHGQWPLLTTAILSENPAATDLLLEHGECVDSPDWEYGAATPLFAAVYMQDTTIVRKLLSRGAEPFDNRALFQASLNRDFHTLDYIHNAFDQRYPNGRKCYGVEALGLAIKKEDMELIHILAKRASADELAGATGTEWSDMTKIDEISALGRAIMRRSSKSLEIIRILARNGANLNGIVSMNGPGLKEVRTALMQAIATKDISKVQELVALGALVNLPARSAILRTPLQYAAELGAIDILHFLLMKGASPNESPATRDGGTALQLAAAKGYLGIVSFLHSIGADINAAPSLLNGRTAFEGACENGRLEMMTFLVENGADILADDGKQYKRAVRFAENEGHDAAKDLADKLYGAACARAGLPVISNLENGFVV